MQPEQWRIELLGGLQVRFQGRTLSHFEMRRAGSLLARLSYRPKQSHPREELMEMLWPEEDPDVTRQRFRQVLTTLRRALESLDDSADRLLQSDRMQVRLETPLFTTDAAEFEQAIRNASRSDDPTVQAEFLDSA